MKLFITGGSGFVGRALCRELAARGHQLHCLIRPGSEKHLIQSPLVTAVTADLFAPDELEPLIKETDAVIHLVGIIREFPARQITFERLHHQATAAIVTATQQAGVKRYLHMSANGTAKEAQSAYHKTKWLAEKVVRQSALDWTIFRPSLIYGTEDQFISLLASLIQKLPLVPVIGTGEYQMQPVNVDVLVKGFAVAIKNSTAIGKTYHCGGQDCISYNQLLDLVGSALGKKQVRKLHQPLSLMRPLVSVLQHLSFFPITADQLQMLLAGNCCDTSEWCKDLDLKLTSLAQGLGYLDHKKSPVNS